MNVCWFSKELDECKDMVYFIRANPRANKCANLGYEVWKIWIVSYDARKVFCAMAEFMRLRTEKRCTSELVVKRHVLIY